MFVVYCANCHKDEFDVELPTDPKCILPHMYMISPDRRWSYPGAGVELSDVYGSHVSNDHNILQGHQPVTVIASKLAASTSTNSVQCSFYLLLASWRLCETMLFGHNA
jgi:hypothetical protein